MNSCVYLTADIKSHAVRKSFTLVSFSLEAVSDAYTFWLKNRTQKYNSEAFRLRTFCEKLSHLCAPI